MKPISKSTGGGHPPLPERERRGTGGHPQIGVGLMETVRLPGLDPHDQQRTGPTTQIGLQRSFILTEGSVAESKMTGFDRAFRWTYKPWNSIPIRYTFVIAWELGKALLERMLKRGNPLNLQPNYPKLNFTPLEMSFTRRPNGFVNLVKDILEGKPYCLLSDMRDGYLYSPEGGSLRNIFSRATAWMIDNPITMMKMKRERAEKLATAVRYYQGKYSGIEQMANEQVHQAIVEVGKRNADIFYRFGFGDTQLEVGEEEVRKIIRTNAKTPEEAETLVKAIEALYTKRTYLDTPNRGYQGAGRWASTIGFVDMAYMLPNLDAKLTHNDDAFKVYQSLPLAIREKLTRAFKLREEGVQEGVEATKAIEFCRSTFYRLAERLDQWFRFNGELKGLDDVRFLSVDELDDLMKHGVMYTAATKRSLQETIDRRKTKLREFTAQ